MQTFEKLLSILLVLVCCSCSREVLSERDLNREQARARADIKRAELESVAGSYAGELRQAGVATNSVSLNLVIKDLPAAIDGQVDPILIPTLTGFLRLVVGAGPEESINYAITRSEYDPGKKRLAFVANNNLYKDMFFSLDDEEEKLSGSWNAPESGVVGTVVFNKDVEAP